MPIFFRVLFLLHRVSDIVADHRFPRVFTQKATHQMPCPQQIAHLPLTLKPNSTTMTAPQLFYCIINQSQHNGLWRRRVQCTIEGSEGISARLQLFAACQDLSTNSTQLSGHCQPDGTGTTLFAEKLLETASYRLYECNNIFSLCPINCQEENYDIRIRLCGLCGEHG